MRRMRAASMTAALALASIAFVAPWRDTPQGKEDGSIVFQFVPKQLDAPIALRSWTLERQNLWRPWIEIENHSNQAVVGITPIVTVNTPTATERLELPEIAARVGAGQTVRLQLELPMSWRDGPWHTYARGAVVTLAFAAVRYGSGTRWESRAAAPAVFTPTPDVEVRSYPGGLIGPRPRNQGNEPMLTSSLSEYPLNSSLDDGKCVIAACRPGGYCEFDGCQVVP